MENIKCPKCESANIKKIGSYGGFNCYARLVCRECNFEGGRVVVYTGEETRVQKELLERFTIDNKKDDVKSFISLVTS